MVICAPVSMTPEVVITLTSTLASLGGPINQQMGPGCGIWDPFQILLVHWYFQWIGVGLLSGGLCSAPPIGSLNFPTCPCSVKFWVLGQLQLICPQPLHL